MSLSAYEQDLLGAREVISKLLDIGTDPLLRELGAIYRHRVKGHVALIDDAGREEMVMRGVPSHYRATVRNDIIRIVPA